MIEKIEKLIALSGSANEHEARSAAFLACKLIREGGYRVVSAQAGAAAADPWDELFRAARPPRRPAARPPPRDTRPRRQVPTEIKVARWSGRCAVCREPYEEGSDIASPVLADHAKLGAAHADCRARWTVPIDP